MGANFANKVTILFYFNDITFYLLLMFSDVCADNFRRPSGAITELFSEEFICLIAAHFSKWC